MNMKTLIYYQGAKSVVNEVERKGSQNCRTPYKNIYRWSKCRSTYFSSEHLQFAQQIWLRSTKIFFNLSLFILPICVIKASDSHLLPCGSCLRLQFVTKALKKRKRKEKINMDWNWLPETRLHCNYNCNNMTKQIKMLITMAYSALQGENIFTSLELMARFWTTTCETASHWRVWKKSKGGKRKTEVNLWEWSFVSDRETATLM